MDIDRSAVKTLMFHRSYFEGVAWMADADRLAYYEAVFRYAFYGEQPEDVPPHVYGSFVQAVPTIDSSVSNHLNGQRGGSKKGLRKGASKGGL